MLSNWSESNMARRKKESGLDSFFNFLVEMPSWIGPICAAVFFIGFRFVIPALLGGIGDPEDPMAKTFDATLIPISTKLAPLACFGVLLIWAMAEAKKFTNRRRLDNQTGLDSIGDLTWQEFEELVAEYYRRQGYQVQITGSTGGDGGVDIHLHRNAQTTLVQCKQWKTWKVDVKVVRELRGVMASQQAEHGIIVTYGRFTADAVEFANDSGITLVGGEELARMIHSVQRKPRKAEVDTKATTATGTTAMPQLSPAQSQAAPSCPQCGTAMVQRTAKRGTNAGSQFWGCPRYPACKGTRAMSYFNDQ